MSMQDFKLARFESSVMQIVPVMPFPVKSLEELPLLSYKVGSQEDHSPIERVHYDIIINEDKRFYSRSQFEGIARQLLTALDRAKCQLDQNQLVYWQGREHFLVQTMANMHQAKCRFMKIERHNNPAATIHEGGQVIVPLAQGAGLRILPERQAGEPDQENVIIKGGLKFFGSERTFTITHAHCQGFLLPEIGILVGEAFNSLYEAFRFTEGNVEFIDAHYISNPVSHQAL